MKNTIKKTILGACTPMLGRMALLTCTFLATSATAGSQSPRESGGRLDGFFESTVTVTNCNGFVLKTLETYQQFNQGGTLTSVDNQPLRTPGIGTWRYNGGGSYSAPTEFFTFNTDGTPAGETKLIRDLQLAPDGNSYTGPAIVEVYDVNGNLIVTLCGTEVGTRVVD